MESSYVTYIIISQSEDSHTLRNNRRAPFFHPPEQTRAVLYTQHFIQGMINKRPDCCNESFMLIDTTYLSLSPSK